MEEASQAEAEVELAEPPKKKNKRSQGPCVRFWVFCDFGEKGKGGKELVGEAWKELPAGVTYLSWQLELGEKTHRLHLQGYVELSRSRYLSWLHAHISSTAGFRKREGSAEEASAYTRKEETRQEGPFELGVLSEGQGSRNDLVEVRELIRGGASTRALLEDLPHMVARYPRFIQTCQRLYRPKYDPEAKGIKVILYYGKTGTGKTRTVYKDWSLKPEFYEMPITSTGTWWDGLDNHTLVLMDDFAGAASHMRLDTLLKILDRYPRRVPVKGDFAWYAPHRVAITTNIHPRKWYDYSDREEQYNALKRRIHKVYCYDKDGPYVAEEDFWEEDADFVPQSYETKKCNHRLNYCNHSCLLKK